MDGQETEGNHTNKMLLSLSQFPDLSQLQIQNPLIEQEEASMRKDKGTPQ